MFELVKAEPPEPPRKKKIAELVRPMLEELLARQDREWHRIVLYPSATGAGMPKGRLAREYSAKEWEWRAVKLPEVDQSAIYVRWLGPNGGGAQ